MTDLIRLADADDLSAIEAIVDAAYGHYIARIGRKPGPMLDDYARLIGACRVHVLERGNAIKGMLVLIPEPATMLLDNIAVAPDVQGAGVGRALMRFAETTARDRGYDAIRLYTHVTMTENLALYARAGYVETHRGEEKGLDRVYMTKRLA